MMKRRESMNIRFDFGYEGGCAVSGSLQDQIQFLIEIDKLKTIERKTRIMHGERL